MKKQLYGKTIGLLLAFTANLALANNFNLPPGFESLESIENSNPIFILPPPEFPSTSPTQTATQEILFTQPSTLPQRPVNSVSPINLQLLANKNHYQSGEALEFAIRSDTACHLTILNQGLSGKTTVLFPNTYRRNNLIQANKHYQIPGDELLPIAALRIKRPDRAVQQYEQIKAICRSSNISLFNTQYNFEKTPFRSFTYDENWTSLVQQVSDGLEATATLNFTID